MKNSYQVDFIPISKISIKKRIRKELGDIDTLAKTIERYGLLNPITVSKYKEKFLLLAGERRLEACKSLAWQEIPAHILELELEASS